MSGLCPWPDGGVGVCNLVIPSVVVECEVERINTSAGGIAGQQSKGIRDCDETWQAGSQGQTPLRN